MSAIQIVNGVLSDDSDVTDLATGGIFAIETPQGTEAPYITINLVSGKDELMMTGAGKYFLHRVTVESIGRTGIEVMNLGDAVLESLGDIVKQEIEGFKDVDMYSADVDFTQPNDSRTAFQRVQQFFVRWRR